MPEFLQSYDFLNNSTALRKAGSYRTFFDPSKQSHLDSFDVFLKTGNWGEVQFFCEAPFSDVPMTVLMKFAMYEQGVTRETPAETQLRFSTMSLSGCSHKKQTSEKA